MWFRSLPSISWLEVGAGSGSGLMKKDVRVIRDRVRGHFHVSGIRET